MCHRNEVNNTIIEDTLEEMKRCSADISEDVLYYAIRQFAHIRHVSYILDILGDIACDIKNNIRDIIQWNYICCEYNVGGVNTGHLLIYNHYIWLLDQYAALFGVTYSKSSRLEKII
jgi:hypothetical protein